MRSIEVSLPGTDYKVTIDLSDDTNKESADLVWEMMPHESIIGHVVVSGGGLWIPTRAVYTGPRVSVQRKPGSVYFYPPMQAICITYGEVRESAFVNEIGRVRDSDLGVLAELGKHVWDYTVVEPKKRPQRVSLNRAGEK